MQRRATSKGWSVVTKLGSLVGAHRHLTILFATILAMAGLYETVWLYRPDYFRVQSDLNLRPIDLALGADRYDLRELTPLPARSNPDLEAAVTRLQGAYDEMQRTSARLASTRRDLMLLRQTVRDGQKAFEDSQHAQLERYVADKARPFLEQAAALRARARPPPSPPPPQIPGEDTVVYGSEEVMLAELRLAELRARLAARRYALTHLNQFQQSPQQQEHVRRLRALRSLEEAENSLANRLIHFSTEVQGAEADYRRSAGSKLNFIDFLYFSIGGATGANFGDISPNHSSIRLMYSAQIIASILLLAMALEKLMTKRG